MGSIGAISAFGSQAVQQRLQQSNVAKPLTALEHAKRIRLGPVGKTEQALHLEKALEMANSKGLSKHTLEYGHQRSSNSLISAVATTTTTTTTELPKKSLKCDGLDNYHPGMFYYTSS